MEEQKNFTYDPNQFEIEPMPEFGEQAIAVIVEAGATTRRQVLDPKIAEKWDDEPLDAPIIYLRAETVWKGLKRDIEEFIAYRASPEGKILVPNSSKAKLRKYYQAYKKLPGVGDKVKVQANAEGYFKLLL